MRQSCVVLHCTQLLFLRMRADSDYGNGRYSCVHEQKAHGQSTWVRVVNRRGEHKTILILPRNEASLLNFCLLWHFDRT